MLVLSRKADQAIRIGDDITICLVAISGDKAKIGIDAPSSVSVHRSEVYDAIQRNGAKNKQPYEPKVGDHVDVIDRGGNRIRCRVDVDAGDGVWLCVVPSFLVGYCKIPHALRLEYVTENCEIRKVDHG